MRVESLEYLYCPECESDLVCKERGDVTTGTINCVGCQKQFPILGGVLVLVSDVESYLLEHVKGIARYVKDSDIPKKYRSRFVEAKREIATEHIEEDLEAERVTALYVMTHYLKANDVASIVSGISGAPFILDLIKKHWDHGPFEAIQKIVRKQSSIKPSLIEFGCGVGGLYAALRNDIGLYLGLDSSFASIVLARHLALGAPLNERKLVPGDLLAGPVSREVNIPKAKTASNAEFIVCDLAEPPVRPALWQMSAALNVTDMLHEPRDMPRLQHLVLRDGGTAIQSCPYIWHPAVAENLRKALPRSIQDSANAVEWLYENEGFVIQSTERNVPWLFYKNARQLEIYSVHVFSAEKSR